MPTQSRRSVRKRSKHGASSAEPLERRLLLSSMAFAAPVNTQISQGAFPAVATAAADLNGDGIPDLVVGRDNLQAQVYLGSKTGAFTLSSIYGSGGDFLALGDFNGDGKTDLATADGIYPGTGTGTFGTLVTGAYSVPAGTINMYAEDVNGDGNTDLVCVTYTSASGQANSAPTLGLTVFLSKGNNTFQGAVTTTIGSAAGINQADAVLSFGNFTGSGQMDVLSPFGVMAGKGDGTFQKATPLPFTGAAAGTTTLPAAPVFATGDFNGDGNLDIATIPASGNNGSVEIFLGNGKGAVTDAGPISITSGQSITSLDSDFLSADGNEDLMVGLAGAPGTQTGTADLAVVVNNGNATFAAPTLYPLAGPSYSITTDDFNADGNIDILSINGVSGSTTSTGLPLETTASVLLNTQAALVAPTLSLRTSANPTVDGDTVKYTATVQATAGTTAAAIPTGAVTFYNDGNAIGTATLVNGKASITTTAAGVGVQSITFNYGGDGNYSSATSSALSQTVLETGAKAPLVLPTLNASITLPPEFLKNDTGTASITLTNGGGAAASGEVNVNFYLSQSGSIDSSAIALPVPALKNHAIEIASGKSLTLTAHLKVGSYPPGNYFLVADVTPVTKLSSDEISSLPVVSTTTFQAAGLVFGSVGNHHSLVLKVADANGQVARFSLTGPGAGAVVQSNGATSLSVTGTTSSSHLSISSGGAFILDGADVRGVLNTFSAPRTTLSGDLNLNNGIKQLSLGSVSSSSGAATLLLGAGVFPPTLSLGAVGDLNLDAAGAIASLSAKTWQSGTLSANSIEKLAVNGSFGANVNTHGGGKVNSARIGAITGGAWAIAGGIGTLHIVGGAADADIYAGVDAGSDNAVDTGDDIFANATIGVLYIGGNVNTMTIAAGVTPIAGNTLAQGPVLLPKGAMMSITLKGAVSSDSRFLAAHLPARVKLNGSFVATATDGHFQL